MLILSLKWDRLGASNIRRLMSLRGLGVLEGGEDDSGGDVKIYPNKADC
jgi:hypothetical protein